MTKYTQEDINLVTRLHRLRNDRDELEDAIQLMVKKCRTAGMSWVRIGSALGTSAQAAWERYGLTPEQKAERSLLNRGPLIQDMIPGLEPTREERIRERKAILKAKRERGSEQY